MNRFLSFLIICGLCLVCFTNCITHQYNFSYLGAKTGVLVPLKVIPIYIDKSFGAADRLALEDAIVQWNYALNGNIVLQVASYDFDLEIPIIRQCLSGGCWMLMKIDSTNAMVPIEKEPGASTLAWANEVGGNRIYFIRDRIYNEWMTGIALHEMGHLLGAGHDKAYLMQPHFHWAVSRCVDYEAAMIVAKYWNLSPGSMRYCVYQLTK